VIGSIVDVALIVNKIRSSGQFVVFFVAYNLYVFLVTVLYLPTRKRSRLEILESEGKFDMNDNLNFSLLEEGRRR